MKQTAVDWLFEQLWDEPKDKLTWYAILKQAKEMERKQITNAYSLGVKEDGIWVKDEILDFLYNEITERRDYSASKMCEVVVDFIENM